MDKNLKKEMHSRLLLLLTSGGNDQEIASSKTPRIDGNDRNRYLCSLVRASRFSLLLLVFVFLGCNGQPEVDSASSEVSRPRPVVTMIVPQPDGPRQVFYPGQMQAAVQTRLSFEQGGTIQDILVHTGSHVQPGQVLARLDPGDYRLAVNDRQARLQEVQARLEEAKSNYRRIKSLYETQNVSRQELDQARGTFKALKAQEEEARNALDQAEQDLADCVLRAPLAGRVADVPMEVHQTLQAGRPVVVLNSEHNMQVQISVPEAVISRVREGDRAIVRIDALPEEEFAARVSEVGVQAGPLSTYPVELTLSGNHIRSKQRTTHCPSRCAPPAGGYGSPATAKAKCRMNKKSLMNIPS
ncbi:MAG: efflux RND transporter periplasmic adaptor subunit [Desulfovermiculus sp.]|nr:efflux RND transporter periplasmic adaptor subunit [Desulfovermiculus sp.]